MSASGEPFSGEIIVYEAPDGEIRVDVRLERETVWLSQRQIAELLDTSTDNVGLHLKNIFDEGELVEAATTEDYSVVQIEGRRKVRRRVRHYNLDAIISVGYRVSSKRGTQFRIWATRTLREHLLRGYTLHERRLRERGLSEIEQAVALLARTLTSHVLEYLRRNGLLTRPDGSPRLVDNAMVALALLIAESEPSHKDLMICLVLNLLGDETP